ncbi:ribosomal RNA small subunit methyltransferase A [Candidatus Uhrbacteria bacterium]|nr:ribosomal RNA small subunit methyltransferase A [Candidatus Uhrbacteria bacterium]
MTPTEIKKVLSDFGARPNKRLGQHFLIDKSVLQTIIETANIKKGDHVLEIGPGLGVLTQALIDCGADVTAIEQDRRMVAYLEHDLSNQPSLISANRRIVHGDAATIHWHELIDERPWKFVSNLPYSITSLALRKALWTPKPPDIVVVLVQREVAERAIAKNGKTSLLSLMVALASHRTRIVKRVPAGAFYPPPKVESAILEIVPMSQRERIEKWGMDPEKIMAIAKLGFAHPRKFLLSNLKSLLVGAGSSRPGPGTRGAETAPLPDFPFNPKIRAEDLAPEQWAELARSLFSIEGYKHELDF